MAFEISTDQTCDFAEHWRYKAPGQNAGLFVAMEPHHIQFATDWANICVISFMEFIAARQAAKKAAANPEAAKPTGIVLTGADA